MLERFECSNATKMRNKVTFDFYSELPHLRLMESAILKVSFCHLKKVVKSQEGVRRAEKVLERQLNLLFMTSLHRISK